MKKTKTADLTFFMSAFLPDQRLLLQPYTTAVQSIKLFFRQLGLYIISYMKCQCYRRGEFLSSSVIPVKHFSTLSWWSCSFPFLYKLKNALFKRQFNTFSLSRVACIHHLAQVAPNDSDLPLKKQQKTLVTNMLFVTSPPGRALALSIQYIYGHGPRCVHHRPDSVGQVQGYSFSYQPCCSDCLQV